VNDTAARVQSLFEQALDLEGPARDAWLAALRSSDADLAARIGRLLTLDAERADPFASAIDALKQTLDFDPAAWVEREIGGFRLLRLLGQGGMGVVYLAERQLRDFQQLVALKLLRGHWVDSSALERFAAERRILARLHHPNIATLIDAGATDEDRPFLVMEYIEGVPLLEYCDAARLDLPARLGLARGLLAALAYAHRALVVHRDLKPGNVLVTPDGTPKLLDFGIARLIETEPAGQATATRVFTPDYASPEQIAGEPVGTGSDLYSLGLILYEMCVGVLPWDNGRRPLSGAPTLPSLRWRQLDAAQRAELAKRRGSDPQHLARRLRGDLGRILARCLEPDPAHRYATVHALEVDLAAFLERRPPPGVQVPRRERMLAFARRHAWPLALSSLAVIAGAALLVQSLLGEHRLAAERDRALAAAHSARVEAAKSAQVAAFVQAMLGGIDPDRAHGMDRSLLRLILDEAAKRASRELGNQPAVRVAIENTIGQSYNGIGEYELAIQHYDAGLKAAADAGTSLADRVVVEVHKADALANLGRLQDAIATERGALRDATGLAPESRERLLAESALATTECSSGLFQSCHDRHQRVLEIQQRVLGKANPDTERSMRGLAVADTNLARYDEARTIYRQLVTRYRSRYGEADSHTLDAINDLAINYLQSKRYADAEALLAPVLPLVERTFGRNHPTTLSMLSNLGGAIRQQPGRNAEARPYYERALRRSQTLYGPDGKRTVFAEINLAVLLRDAGELPDAERHARAAVGHMDKAFGSASAYNGMLLDKLATILMREHKYAEAERTLDQAWAVLSKAPGFGPAHPESQTVVGDYIKLYTDSKQPALAGKWRSALNPPAASPAS
jgi:non-specific serine/threonine protein kinase/serine/threonine-protein kinase